MRTAASFFSYAAVREYSILISNQLREIVVGAMASARLASMKVLLQ